MNNNYELIKASLSQADKALEIFKIDLSPTSSEALARHIAKHTLGMLGAAPKPMDLMGILIGLMLKLTCDKEARAFLKAAEAADAATDE